MKNNTVYIFLCVVLLLPELSRAQQVRSIYDLYERLAQEEGNESVYISPRMFSLFSKSPNEDTPSSLDKAIKKLTGLRILHVDREHRDNKELFQTAHRIMGSEYEMLMQFKDDSSHVQFFVTEDPTSNLVTELVMLSKGYEDFFLMILSGNLALKEINTLADSLDIEVDGFERLRTHEGRDP